MADPPPAIDTDDIVDLSAFGSGPHRERRAEVMRRLTSARSEGGLGLTLEAFSEVVANTTKTTCENLFKTEVSPNKFGVPPWQVGHEFFYLAVWRQIYLDHRIIKLFPWEEELVASLEDLDSQRSTEYGRFHARVINQPAQSDLSRLVGNISLGLLTAPPDAEPLHTVHSGPDAVSPQTNTPHHFGFHCDTESPKNVLQCSQSIQFSTPILTLFSHQHAMTNNRRPKKRKMTEASGESTHQRQLVTHQEGYEPDPHRLTVDKTVPPLPMLDPVLVGIEPRDTEPSFVQTAEDEINFYTPDRDRPLSVNAYCIKFSPDDTSMEAMLRTLKELCILHNASAGNIFLELETKDVTKTLREEAKRLAAKAALEAERRGPLSARVTLPPQSSRRPHVAGQCLVSTKRGLVTACPTCNTKHHDLDGCRFLANQDIGDPVFIANMLDVVVTQRANRPLISSQNWKFQDVLYAAVNAGVVRQDDVLHYPWSRAFARAVRKAEPNDSILGGKLHPKVFNYATDRRDGLPVDPGYHGKTVGEMIQMAYWSKPGGEPVTHQPEPELEVSPPPQEPAHESSHENSKPSGSTEPRPSG